MLSIFQYCYGAVDTVLMMRMINRRLHSLAKDPYIQNNFRDTGYSGVQVEIRSAQDFTMLEKAIRYSEIINASAFLNLSVYYEFSKKRH